MIANPKPPARAPKKRKPIAKTRTPRTWACKMCVSRNPGTRKSCEGCGTRRGSGRTALKQRCDKMARELCRDLAGGLCARCGGPGTDWAHRMPRRHHSMRWDMTNCDWLCRPCHQFFTDHPMGFTIWLQIHSVDEGFVEDLERRANAPWDKSYERVLTYLKAERKKMEAK